jgi:hypothetical protein
MNYLLGKFLCSRNEKVYFPHIFFCGETGNLNIFASGNDDQENPRDQEPHFFRLIKSCKGNCLNYLGEDIGMVVGGVTPHHNFMGALTRNSRFQFHPIGPIFKKAKLQKLEVSFSSSRVYD